ncbi:MAG: PQQ-dependent sugar dehydrogenase [Holophagales bacterium]|nr:PQQ-dependent sugar dehydrogenase [Holophagales bacterium]
MDLRRALRTRFSALLLFAAVSAADAQPVVPAGFVDELVATVGGPTAMAFTPDGRLLVTRQSGSLRVVSAAGALLPTPALTLPSSQICTNFERGLLGVAVDPAFGANRYVYLFYTRNVTGSCATGVAGARNRVSRFVLPDSNVIDPGTETVLVDGIRSFGGNHNGGDLRFGRDGFLYVSTGDGGTDYAGDSGSAGANDAARDQFHLLGKILRITRDGGIPASNPFQGAGTARCNATGETTPGNRCQETFAWGFRNPFRFATDPNTAGTRIFVNDIGQGVREEVDALTAGADYGWNCREGTRVNSTTGKCSPTPAGISDPFFEYSHGPSVVPGTSISGCNSITGGAFVPNGVWPAEYDGSYLLADYVCGAIFRIPASGAPPASATTFVSGLGGSSATTLLFGPHGETQALYYTTYASGGQVRRLRYAHAGSNQPPSAVIGANPTAGDPPLEVTFSGAGSSDPNAGDTLAYFWDFGDGSPVVQTAAPSTSKTYPASGAFLASLRVRDQALAFSAPASVTISVGNRPPTASIDAPPGGASFGVGQAVTITGSGTDPDEGAVPPERLHWTVLLHHDVHTHPFLSGTGAGISFAAPGPEDLAAAANSFLEVHLQAEDASGLFSPDVRLDLQPRKWNVTLGSVPGGARLTVNGEGVTAPATFVSWEGWGLTLGAPDQVLPDGRRLVFSSWSDGEAQTHTVTTPAADLSRSATFGVVGSELHVLAPCRAVDTRTSGGPLAPAETRAFTVAGECGVPASAYALVVNVTAVSPAAPGTLSLFPGHLLASPATSTVAFAVGRTRAVGAVMLLAADGSGTLKATNASTGQVDVVLDVSGYFE